MGVCEGMYSMLVSCEMLGNADGFLTHRTMASGRAAAHTRGRRLLGVWPCIPQRLWAFGKLYAPRMENVEGTAPIMTCYETRGFPLHLIGTGPELLCLECLGMPADA